SDYRGKELVDGIVRLVQQHRPLHLSLVGGEPLVRHRELSRVLPILSSMKVHTMVVTSAVIPIPVEWMSIPRVRVTVSVDGLPEHHDVRRKPATYERILKNIAGCQVNMHGTITRPMLECPHPAAPKSIVPALARRNAVRFSLKRSVNVRTRARLRFRIASYVTAGLKIIPLLVLPFMTTGSGASKCRW